MLTPLSLIHPPITAPPRTRPTRRPVPPSSSPQPRIARASITTAIDDPRKVVKVEASDGKSGELRDVSYTNCKVIGNGSFGVVFQAKLVSGPDDGQDIAIKKVLQDKRFKVRPSSIPPTALPPCIRTADDHPDRCRHGPSRIVNCRS